MNIKVNEEVVDVSEELMDACIRSHYLEMIEYCAENILSVPDKYLDQKFYEEAVKVNGMTLYDIPKENHTSEMYRVAVSKDGQALGAIPELHRTKMLCYIAVASYGPAIKFVPEKFLSDELYILAYYNRFPTSEGMLGDKGLDAVRKCRELQL